MECKSELHVQVEHLSIVSHEKDSVVVPLYIILYFIDLSWSTSQRDRYQGPSPFGRPW
jgi:hypothetical protein